jgi:hypothetical protein
MYTGIRTNHLCKVSRWRGGTFQFLGNRQNVLLVECASKPPVERAQYQWRAQKEFVIVPGSWRELERVGEREKENTHTHTHTHTHTQTQTPHRYRNESHTMRLDIYLEERRSLMNQVLVMQSHHEGQHTLVEHGQFLRTDLLTLQIETYTFSDLCSGRGQRVGRPAVADRKRLRPNANLAKQRSTEEHDEKKKKKKKTQLNGKSWRELRSVHVWMCGYTYRYMCMNECKNVCVVEERTGFKESEGEREREQERESVCVRVCVCVCVCRSAV